MNVARSFDDPRIRIICSDENRGSALTKNVGLENARGEYIYFIDSDDAILPNAPEKSMEVIERGLKPVFGKNTIFKLQNKSA